MEQTELRQFRRYGENKKGVNNKFYAVEADERENGRATWLFKWGRIGSAGQTKEGVSSSFRRAAEICKAQFEKKEKRGYREVSPLEALASCIEEPEERPNNGLPAVEIDIPCWHAGESNVRLDKFAAKYLKKLNIIRASFYSLDDDAYRRQIETLLKQYAAEYARMLTAKAHGRNMTHDTKISARIFFFALQDNAGETIWTYVYGWNR